MKKILFLLIALAFSFAAPANAQQNQQLRRSRSIFLYPEFQKAKYANPLADLSKPKPTSILRMRRWSTKKMAKSCVPIPRAYLA